MKEGKSASAKEIQPVIQCYREGKIVIGSDYRLKLPIWNLTREAVWQLLEGASTTDVLEALDAKAKEYSGRNE